MPIVRPHLHVGLRFRVRLRLAWSCVFTVRRIWKEQIWFTAPDERVAERRFTRQQYARLRDKGDLRALYDNEDL